MQNSLYQKPCLTQSRSSRLGPQSVSYNWIDVGPEDDGYYITTVNGSLVLENVFDNQQRKVLLPPAQRGDPPRGAVSVNADQSKALFATNNTKQYRYSFFANYDVQNLLPAQGPRVPLDPNQKTDVQYVTWSPK